MLLALYKLAFAYDMRPPRIEWIPPRSVILVEVR
jgi:hypothetical protein